MKYPYFKAIVMVHPLTPTLQLLRELEQRMVKGVTFTDVNYEDVSDGICFMEKYVEGTTLTR